MPMEDFEPINRYRADEHPTNDTDPSGGDISSTLIVDGEEDFLPPFEIPESGGADYWYYAEKHKVENGSGESVPSPGWYVRNGLFLPSTATVLSVVSDDPDDEGTVRLTFINNGSGEWDSDEIDLTGTTASNGIVNPQIGTDIYAECVSSSGSLETAIGNRFIYCGSQLLGFIPAGKSVASSLFKLAIAPDVNNTFQVDTRLDNPYVEDPGEVSDFAYAYNPATMLQLAGAIDLDDDDFATLWWEVKAPEGMIAPIGQLKPILTIRVALAASAGGS